MSTCAPAFVPPVRRSSPLWKGPRSLPVSVRRRRGRRRRSKARVRRQHQFREALSARSAALPSSSGKVTAVRSKRRATSARRRPSTFPSRSTPAPTENAPLDSTRKLLGVDLAVGAELLFVFPPVRMGYWSGNAKRVETDSRCLPVRTRAEVQVEVSLDRVATAEAISGPEQRDADPGRSTTGNVPASGVARATSSPVGLTRVRPRQSRARGPISTQT